jgi:hypothetical protein
MGVVCRIFSAFEAEIKMKHLNGRGAHAEDEPAESI